MRPLPLPAFDDNYIWMLADAAGRALVVDPGQAGPVRDALQARGLELAAILLTHHHPDHTGGVSALLERWPGALVAGPRDPRIPTVTVPVGDGDGDGDGVRAGDWRFEVLATPGHTSSHIAFHGHGLLFSGDTLFSLGCGRMFEGTPGEMLGSLDRLAALPPATRVCCGHEYTLANAAFARVVDPDNPALRRRHEQALAMRHDRRPTLPALLADELASNPFLRVDAPAIRAAVAAHDPAARDQGRTGIFAALRRWKDGFRA